MISTEEKVFSTVDEKYYTQARRDIEPLLPGQRSVVLELGCGAGSTMAWLKSLRPVRHAEAIELFPPMAERARTHFDLVHEGDIDDWQFTPTRSDFDLVLALDVLEHLRDPWQTLRRIRGHMAPGGTIIASIPNVAHYSVALPLAWKGRWDYTQQGLLDRTHLRFFTRETVKTLFHDTGFQIKRLEVNTKFPNLFSIIGLNNNKWLWYSQKIISSFAPNRMTDFQFLVSAEPSNG